METVSDILFCFFLDGTKKKIIKFCWNCKVCFTDVAVSTLHSNGFIAPPAGEMFVCKLQGKKPNGDDVLITGLCCGDGHGSQIWAGSWFNQDFGATSVTSDPSSKRREVIVRRRQTGVDTKPGWEKCSERFFFCLITKIIEARFLHRRDWLAPLTHTLDSSRHLQRRAPKSY